MNAMNIIDAELRIRSVPTLCEKTGRCPCDDPCNAGKIVVQELLRQRNNDDEMQRAIDNLYSSSRRFKSG